MHDEDKKAQIQKDLQFLLKNGWKLVDVNRVQYEQFVFDDICKAAKFFRLKLEIQAYIQRNKK